MSVIIHVNLSNVTDLEMYTYGFNFYKLQKSKYSKTLKFMII